MSSLIRYVPEDFIYFDVVLSRFLYGVLTQFARRYRTTPSGMISIILRYYFGDGYDHLRCEHCIYGSGGSCTFTADDLEDHNTLT